MEIAILMTCFNRKYTTIASLKSLYTSIATCTNKSFDIYLVDDNSPDGTYDIIKKEFPQIVLIKGTGNLYWSGGMRKAWDTATQIKKYDFFIWFNDDAILYECAISKLFEALNNDNNTIVSGAFKFHTNNSPSYGGKDKKGNLLSPNGTYQNITYMNGNLVLIPYKVYNQLGTIDSFFTHGGGDWDYGLRALKKGIKVILTDCYIGKTNRHDEDLVPFLNPKFSLKKRLSLLYSSKYSISERIYFDKRHYGIITAYTTSICLHIYTLFPYLNTIKRILKQKFRIHK